MDSKEVISNTAGHHGVDDEQVPVGPNKYFRLHF